MNLSLRVGEVLNIVEASSEKIECIVAIDGVSSRAIAYPAMVAELQVGDCVLLNTTAVEMNLGTGGFHYVVSNLGSPEIKASGPGHIMKLRYTPLQIKTLCGEEMPEYHEMFNQQEDIAGMPVVALNLHSQLPYVVAGIKAACPQARIVYLQTDGAALPVGFSKIVSIMKQKNFIRGVISCGHAFGGDIEAVNVYSALILAKISLQADVVVVGMGPGIVGTGTWLGFTGVEQAAVLHAVHALEGIPIAVCRIGFADKRPRHNGLSHHSQTVLGRLLLCKVHLVLPQMEAARHHQIYADLEACGATVKHELHVRQVDGVADLLLDFPIKIMTMGRDYAAEPEYFDAAAAAGIFAGEKVAANG
jgi:hypothetical protein